MTNLSIIAGNPALATASGRFDLISQDIAFNMAISAAQKHTQGRVKIYLPVDHEKRFTCDFVDQNRISSQSKLDRLQRRRELVIADLTEEIRDHFDTLLSNTNLTSEDIVVLPESKSRMSATSLNDSRAFKGSATCNTNSKTPNCSGITSSIYRDVSQQADLLVGFWEVDMQRVVPAVIHEGTRLAYELRDVRCHTINIFIEPPHPSRQFHYCFDERENTAKWSEINTRQPEKK